MADDMGWADWGWGASAGASRTGDPVHPHLETPHLDRLAASGVTFERFYAAAPVCSPTRGSVLTGRHPRRYGIRGANSGHLLESEVTLAELLKDAGYATGFFGKWHLGTFTTTEKDSNRGGREKHAQHFSPPGRHGFDEWFATEAKVPTHDPMVHPDTGEPYGTAYWRTDGSKETENLDGDDSRVIVDRALPFVRACAEEQRPFLAVVWFHAPHLPVVAGEEDLARYAHVESRPAGRQTAETRSYLACLSALDREVGRIVDALDELGLRDDTIVWFMSDNGPEGKDDAAGSTGGLRGRKRALYEGGVRVPGIVSWPARLAARTRAATPAVTSDILPTVAEWVGLPAPDLRLDGASLAGRLTPGPAAVRPPIGFWPARTRRGSTATGSSSASSPRTRRTRPWRAGSCTTSRATRPSPATSPARSRRASRAWRRTGGPGTPPSRRATSAPDAEPSAFDRSAAARPPGCTSRRATRPRAGRRVTRMSATTPWQAGRYVDAPADRAGFGRWLADGGCGSCGRG